MDQSISYLRQNGSQEMLITLRDAAKLMGYEAAVKDKRTGNRIWEPLRKRELLQRRGVPLGRMGVWADFPAVKLGQRWMVYRDALFQWMERHWTKPAA